MMNIWEEAYPKDFKQLITSCDQSITIIENLLKSEDCKCLGDLYISNNKDEITRNKELFEKLGYMPNSKLNRKSTKDDELSGLYVFGEINEKNNNVVPIYIGISRTIFRRLKQHGWGKKHNEATLAALKAIKKGTHSEKLRSSMKEEVIKKQQEIVRKYKVAILPVTDYYTMYFMEVYLAGKWKTKWNSFKTH